MPTRGKDRKVIVEIAIEKLVPVTSNDGGYKGRTCLLCNETGWEDQSDVGYRYRSEVPGNRLIHSRMCLLNQYIDRVTGKVITK
jgi:hypothetical protein